jgi:hypothetical protein
MDYFMTKQNKLHGYYQSTSELYQPSGHCGWRSWCRLLWVEGVVWSVKRIPMAINLSFLDHSHYFSQLVPQLPSRGWVDSIPDPLLLRKSGSAGNRTCNLGICGQELRPLDHRGGLGLFYATECLDDRLKDLETHICGPNQNDNVKLKGLKKSMKILSWYSWHPRRNSEKALLDLTFKKITTAPSDPGLIITFRCARTETLPWATI